MTTMTAKRTHKITMRGKGRNFRAFCECGWRSRGHAVRVEAAQEAGMHKLEMRYGKSA